MGKVSFNERVFVRIISDNVHTNMTYNDPIKKLGVFPRRSSLKKPSLENRKVELENKLSVKLFSDINSCYYENVTMV